MMMPFMIVVVMFMAAAIFVIMVVLMSMSFMVMMMLMAAAIFVIMVAASVMIMVKACFIEKIRRLGSLLYRITDHFPVKLIPWCCDDGSIRVFFPDQSDSLFEF